MAHNLTIREGGEVEMFSAGTTPVWHKLGQRTDKAVTSAEAIKLAHLDWEVQQREIDLVNPMGPNRRIKSHKAIVRADNGFVLGVVSDRYTPLQNHEAFDWLDAVVGERLAMYETAGSLHGGRTVWMMVRVPRELRVPGTDDITKPYVLVSNTHDGTRALRILNCTVRVVCNNTLTMALRHGEESGLKLRHTASIRERVDEARQTLGIASRRFDEMQRQMEVLNRRRLDKDQVHQYFVHVWPDNPQVENQAGIQSVRNRMLQNFEEESERMRGIGGTAWAAFNAVSKYTDWQRPTRGSNQAHRDNNRLASIWLGDSASVKRRAWDKALQLAVN